VLAVYSVEAGGSNPGVPVALCVEGHSSPGEPGSWNARILVYQVPVLFRVGGSAAKEPGFPRLDEDLLTQAIPNPCHPLAGITGERHFSWRAPLLPVISIKNIYVPELSFPTTKKVYKFKRAT
jgi:hypothetical protein